MEIRFFKPDDRQLVEDFYNQMGNESRFFFNPVGSNYRRTMRYFGDHPDNDILHWMALEDGKMVGYVFIWQVHSGVVELGIAVADDYKGHHLGEKLIDTVKDWCRQNGKGGILLTTHPANKRAQALYTRCGFEHIGTANFRGEFLYLFNFPEEAAR